MEHPQLPEDPEPACTFRYTLDDDTQRELTLVPIDDVTYWAYVDGRCVGMTVRRNALSGTSGVLNFLEKLTDSLDEQGISYTPRTPQAQVSEELSEDETQEQDETTKTAAE